ncbi:Endoplasmic reticulum metallopeptidase 1 [Spatholobus suberectus]|nr:Endoplasmic reticulum metallopeptidase 1 [Spatholobus suberectus]
MFGSAASKVVSSVPVPGTTKKETGFSEDKALKHIKALTEMASPPASSVDQSPLLQYVLDQSESIKETAHGDVKVEVDRLSAKYGDSVVLKVLPKNVSEAEENDGVLVSAHVDPVFAAGATDDTSNVAVMLELARGLSQSSTGFKNSVIFFFNTGEEEGLDGSHSFITQHPFGKTVRLAIDLDSIGSILKSSTSEDTGSKNPVIFLSKIGEEGTQKLILDLEAFSTYPRGKHIDYGDLFSSGVIKSATDFKVYKEIAGVSGLDFPFIDETAV